VEILSACSQSAATPVSPVNLETAVGQAVRTELRRKKNGFPQIEGKKDCDVVHNFCEDHLEVKPWFDEGKCRRIGHWCILLAFQSAAQKLTNN